VCQGYEPWERVIPIPHVQHSGAYQYAAVARKFIKLRRVGLTLVTRTTLLIGTIKDAEVVVINALADKDVGDEFQDCGLADTSFSNEKDGVWCFNLIL